MKRIVDIVGAVSGLVLLSPVLGLIAVLIRFSTPGPSLHPSWRVGKDGKLFRLYKFRSMVDGADRSGPGITRADDPRITEIGRLLRRYKLDELPQLINVIKGDMSLVGPRPEDPKYVALYTVKQRGILSVRPGITSPASLNHRDEQSLLMGEAWEKTYREEVMPRKLAMDLEYIQRATVWTDISIIFQTVRAIFRP